MRKRSKPGEENIVFKRMFWKRCIKENDFLVNQWSVEICSVFQKNQRKWESKEEICWTTDTDGGLRPFQSSHNTFLIEHAILFFTELYCRFTAFRRTSTVSEHSKLGDFCRGITHCTVLNLWHHDSFLHIFLSSIMCKITTVSPSVLIHHSHTSSFRVNHSVIWFSEAFWGGAL